VATRRWFARPLTIRAALLAGFGLTLGLWLVAGYHVTLRMRQAQRDAAAVSSRYLHAQDLLSAIRAQVLVSSVLVRDTLLDPDSALATTQRQEIDRAHDAIDDQLGRYIPFVGSQIERERLASLRSEALRLRTAAEDALATNRGPLEARAALRRFLPQREAAVRVSEEVQALNRAAFVEQQEVIADRQASMQQQVLTVFGVALVISLSIGWLAFHHTARLEHRMTEQRAREEQIGLDLQRLSGKLIHIQEDERRRIARELHDAVGQALSAVKVELLVAERKLARTPWAAHLLSDAQANADSALRSIRDLSHLLHPATLDDLGLVAAIDSYLTDFGKRHEVGVRFMHQGIDGRQPAEVERAVYRIVQEALANVAHHAAARNAGVVLTADDHALHAVIEDDGVGFVVADAEQPGRRRGLGLLSIRERALQLGGAVSVTSRADFGTRILVDLPLRPQPTGMLDTSNTVAGPSLLTGAPEVGHG
jgi:signal transduction histidine kinase